MKKLSDLSESIEIKRLWSHQTPYKFNVICVGTLFRQSGLNLVLGGEDGIIRLYDLSLPNGLSSPQISLETKSGPIQSMAIHDVTRFYHNDLIVADSCGIMTVFCNQQILCRKSVAKDSINYLQVEQDKTGNLAIVTGTEAGVISGVLPSSELWRININNLSATTDPTQKLSIRSLLAADLLNQQGQRSSYILAADDTKRLFVIHQGTVVLVLKLLSVITAMCQGKFVSEDKLTVASQPNGSSPSEQGQVALASQNGAVYIFHNFNVTEDEYANTQYPITCMKTVTLPDRETDLLLCAGHFNALHVYSDGKKVGQYTTPDWICTMDKADLDGDGATEVVLGCMDNSVHAIKLAPT